MAVVLKLSNAKPYIGLYKRPFADITLIGPKGRFSISACLVDSGADYFQVPDAAAIAVGLLPSASAKIVKISTANGAPASLTILSGVTVEIEGISVIIDVACASASSPALVGRNAFFALKNVGFDITGWLW